MLGQIGNYFAAGVGRITGYLPNLVSAIIILVVGYFVCRLLDTVARRLLARAHFDNYVSQHLRRATKRAPSSTVGSAVFWLGMLVTLSLTANALGLASLNAGLNRILEFVPRVIVAAIIVGIAIALANVLADLVGDVGNRWVARAVRVAVIALSVFMALDELGIARNIVMTTFTACLGAAAIAAAIAFGVGNIPLARDYSARWTRRSQRPYEATGPGEKKEPLVVPPPGSEGPEEPLRH
jgi:hypothetical protein